MERTNDPVLSVRNLSVSFADAAGTLHAVDDVSFDVPEGGILGVVGESGSGKTVSLMSTMGMIESSTMRVSGSRTTLKPGNGRLSPLRVPSGA